MKFQIKTLAKQGTMPFQDYVEFIDWCEKCIVEDKANVFEFYLHNLALIDLNVWDPNAKLGDL